MHFKKDKNEFVYFENINKVKLHFYINCLINIIISKSFI